MEKTLREGLEGFVSMKEKEPGHCRINMYIMSEME